MRRSALLAALVLHAACATQGPPAGRPGTSAADRLAESINVREEGAVGDGVTDDTAAIQRALDRLPAGWKGTSGSRRVWFPAGDYRVTRALVVKDKALWQLEGSGAMLWWDGPDAGGSIFHFTGYHSRGRVDGLNFSVRPGHRALAALRFDGGGGNGEHLINQVSIFGDLDLRFDYGVLTTGLDANNDHFKLTANHIDYVKVACVRFEKSQSKAHVLVGNRFQSFSPTGYGVMSGGSYYWWGGAMGSNDADFLQTGISGVDAIYIGGVNSEGSKRFFGPPLWTQWEAGKAYTVGYAVVRASNGFLYQATSTGTSGVSEPVHLSGTVSDGGVSWTYGGASLPLTSISSDYNGFPITIESVRFGSYATRLDGIERLDGSHTVLKPDATLTESDSTRPGATTVGWAAVINYRNAGPIFIRNCQFQPSNDERVRRLKFLLVGSIAGTNGIVEGNMVAGSTVRVSPVWNPGARPHLVGNMLWPNRQGLDHGEHSRGFPEYHDRPAVAGQSHVEKAGFGSKLKLVELADHVRVKLDTASLDAIALPDGQAGQVLTLEFVQTSYMHGALPASAWPPNVVLTSGPFLMPWAHDAVATISLRWNPAGRWDGSTYQGAWVETGRANAGPLLTGAGSPEGTVTAAPGALYVRTDGAGATLLYRKAVGTGASGWVVMPAQGGAQADSSAADVARLRSDFNALLENLRRAGVLAP